MNEEKLDELWETLALATNIDDLEYDEAVTIGSVFGQMRTAIEALQAENQRLNRKYIEEYAQLEVDNQRYKNILDEAEATLQEVASWYGINLQVANWHMNGDYEPLDGFIDNLGVSEMLEKIQQVFIG